MRKFGRVVRFGLVLALVLALVTPVFADSYKFRVPVTVIEYGGDVRTGVPILVDFSNQGLADLGFLKSTGLDSRVGEAGTNRDYMVGSAKLGFLVPSLASYQNKEFAYYTSYSPDNEYYGVVVGENGYITVSDDEDLELGDSFGILVTGWINTSDGADKDIIFKDGAFKLYISAEGSITASIFNSDWVTTFVTATGLTSGSYAITVVADGVDLMIYIDGEEIDDTTVVGVVDTNDDWIIARNGTMPYLDNLQIWVGS